MTSLSTFSRDFFHRAPLLVARDLIGAELRTISSEGITSGKIIEVEAYGANDEASHSFRGISKRNKSMFAAGGNCYVYLCYGIHHCVNVVTEAEGIGSAVLIRALEPLNGVDLMMKRRACKDLKNLTSGPGKLCEALAITESFDGLDLLSSPKISLIPGNKIPDNCVSFSERIGITKARQLAWRIYLRDSRYLSRSIPS